MQSSQPRDPFVINHSGLEQTLVDSVLGGLGAAPRHLSSALLYDSVGCGLFERITKAPEYYLTRLELSLLVEAAPSLAPSLMGRDIVELGSGSCEKVSVLLDAIPRERLGSIRYIPIDVSQTSIDEATNTLTDRFSGLDVDGIVGDFVDGLASLPTNKPRVFCFLGSTLGNMSQTQRAAFFAKLSRVMQSRDMLILGVDLLKPRRIVEMAYNDSDGITAAFNRNVLRVVNRLAGTDFEPDSFEHVASYNDRQGRIEMSLEARRDMLVESTRHEWETKLFRGERILTEYSHKFSVGALNLELKLAGLSLEGLRSDRQSWYALLYLKKEQGPPKA